MGAAVARVVATRVAGLLEISPTKEIFKEGVIREKGPLINADSR
jgi:hypothetical protein